LSIIKTLALKNNEAIRLASATGNADIVRMLLTRREVNPGAMDSEALMEATKRGHSDVVRLLLAHPKVKSSARNYLAVFTAIRNNHEDIVKLIINNERDIPSRVGLQIIERATNFRNIELVQFLLNHQSFKGVMYSIFHSDNLPTIKAAVEAGYKIDQSTLDIFLQHARSNGNDDIVEYLESLKEIPKLPEQPLTVMTKQCIICLSDENILQGYMTACNHQFHAECLQQWIAKHNSCPMCRSSII